MQFKLRQVCFHRKELMLDTDVTLLQSQSRSVMGTDIRDECSVCRVERIRIQSTTRRSRGVSVMS
jgi:hypothetical protein